MKSMIASLLVFVASHSQAARVWEITDNYVEHVAIYVAHIGSAYYDVVEIKLKNPIATGCGMTDSTRTVRTWKTGGFDLIQSALYSAAVTAKTLETKIEVMTDNAVCNPSFGRFVVGLKVL